MPAYNAEMTLRKTYNEIPHDIVDEVILTDDASSDKTAEISKSLGIKTLVHTENLGYGANQKTCYEAALKIGADIVVMIHPDYQYPPRLITAMAGLLASDLFDVVLDKFQKKPRVWPRRSAHCPKMPPTQDRHRSFFPFRPKRQKTTGIKIR